MREVGKRLRYVRNGVPNSNESLYLAVLGDAGAEEDEQMRVPDRHQGLT